MCRQRVKPSWRESLRRTIAPSVVTILTTVQTRCQMKKRTKYKYISIAILNHRSARLFALLYNQNKIGTISFVEQLRVAVLGKESVELGAEIRESDLSQFLKAHRLAGLLLDRFLHAGSEERVQTELEQSVRLVDGRQVFVT